MGHDSDTPRPVSTQLLQASLEKALSEVAQLREERDDYKRKFDLVTHSASWKLTAPLRIVVGKGRNLFPLYRSRVHEVKLSIVRSLELRDSRYVISGPTPTIDVDLVGTGPSAMKIRPGWYSFDARVTTPKGTLFFFLYLGRNKGETKGFNEAERFLLSFEDGQPGRQLIWIPEGISCLRLEVYDFDSEFTLSEVRLRAIGSLNVGGLLFKQKILPLLSEPSVLLGKLKKAWHCYREGGLPALKAKIFGGRVTTNYNEWVQRFDVVADEDRAAIKTAAQSLRSQPKISIITPVYNPPIQYFRQCLGSVLGQAYDNWELCLADDCSTNPEVKEVIEEYRAKDSRIKVVYREKSGHISAASNSALAVATGDYVAFLDHDDELTLDALYLVALEINKHPDAQLIYSDEDKKTAHGIRINPHFKSDWNPELLLHQNYICHLLVIKKEAVDKVGGLRTGFDGAQDWDLILRVSETIKEEQIRHIPHILYHWTIIPGSTAQSTAAKPYVLEAQAKAVQEHLDRTGQHARAKIWHSISHIAVDRAVGNEGPNVSLIILTRDKVKLLRQCVDTLLSNTSYKNYEVIVVDNGSVEPETFAYFDLIKRRPNVKVIRDERPFNFSALNNFGASHCSGEVLGFLNNDLEFVKPHWLEKMVAQALRKDVGAVGARLLFPNNLLQHGGVIIGIGGVAGHNHKGRPKEDTGYFNRAILSQNLSAVTAACLLMRRDVFDRINGFDEQLSVAFNDVDLCLRIREAGFKIVYEPDAELYHHESASRGYENTAEKFARFEREVETMKGRWKDQLRVDPYYNPNLTNLSEDFVFAFPPRVQRAWRE
jgi:GT2 family glycosyltransferase